MNHLTILNFLVIHKSLNWIQFPGAHKYIRSMPWNYQADKSHEYIDKKLWSFGKICHATSMPRTVCFRTKGQDFSRVNFDFFDFCTFFIATQLSKSQLDQSPYVIRSFIVLKSAFHCLPTTVILRKTVFSTSLLVQWFYISLFSLLPFRDIAMKKMGGGQSCILV